MGQRLVRAQNASLTRLGVRAGDGEPLVLMVLAVAAVGVLTWEAGGLPWVSLGLATTWGMYAFFSIDGQPDCLNVAKRLVREAGLGLAPGSAFGPEASGWLRWCSRPARRCRSATRSP